MKDPSDLPFASVDAKLRRRVRLRKQPIQARSKATTDAVLDATLQVLIKHGYDKLTTTRVAERAGVSVGTLYQYFPDKRSLVAALKARYFALMVSAVADASERAPTTNPRAMIRHTLAALLEVKQNNISLTRALREPLANPDGMSFVRDTSEQFVRVLAPSVQRAFPRLESVERRVTMLVAALEGAISHAVFVSPDWLSEPWFLDELVAIGASYLVEVASSAERAEGSSARG